MVFNLQKFLIENGLTKRARLKEDAETKTDAEKLAMSADEGDEETGDQVMFDPDNDNPYKADSISDDSNEALPVSSKNPPGNSKKDKDDEPPASAVRGDRTAKKLSTKQTKLKALEDQKDKLLMQLKSGQLTLDQYKSAIGNIPTQIKKLRADIDRETSVSFDDLDDEEI